MKRAYYSDSLTGFFDSSEAEILGKLCGESPFAVDTSQVDAWREQVSILKEALSPFGGKVYFEYSIPRMGRRIDAVLIIQSVIFVLEFKAGGKHFNRAAIDQVYDYALDLKNFHEETHDKYLVPVLIPTEAHSPPPEEILFQQDKLHEPVRCAPADIRRLVYRALEASYDSEINHSAWESGRYSPTPTIIEAARALYHGHAVSEISRSDAGAVNLTATSEAVYDVIRDAKKFLRKSICFVTGVPGAGKTLVGLNLASRHNDKKDDFYSVFLSGNGPLVKILVEALARDRVERAKELGERVRKGEAAGAVKSFIQNVHHFRDEGLVDMDKAPFEHIAIFDEAQRAWNMRHTSNFMSRKKKRKNFNRSEPEFLVSCMDRHRDWAVIVCLVGGGQEINTGEAGIGEWITPLRKVFPGWHIHISPRLTDSEYEAGEALRELEGRPRVYYDDRLHLSVSLRSFRAENVSALIKHLLDLNGPLARKTLKTLSGKYPIVLTRDPNRARRWLREKARGSERYGMVVSSNAERLKPYAIDVKSPMNPVHWFLNDKDDVRSSYYLEQVATEFHIQGLELDWAGVTWDADLRYGGDGWSHKNFKGKRWENVNSEERRRYQKNAYRVLLTRARQGMVIVVPEGDAKDHTRKPGYYDPTFDYLRGVGFDVI